MAALCRVGVALSVGLVAETSAGADASSQRFSLSWTRSPDATECISARVLANAVEEHLRRRVFEPPGSADVAIEGHVERSDAAWRVTLSVTDGTGKVAGKRELASADPNCHDLDAPLVITIALLIDPDSAISETPPPNPRPSEQPPPGTRPPAPESHPPVVPDEKTPQSSIGHDEPWRSWVEVDAALAVGLLPTVSPGVVMGVGIVPPGIWPLTLSGALWTDEPVPSGGSSPVDFSLATAGLGTCPITAKWRIVGLSACASLDFGLMSTHGLSDGTILTRRRFVIAAAARVEGTLALGSHWFLGIGGGPSVPFIRDFFDYETGSETHHLVFRMSPVGAVFFSGLGLRTP